MVDEPRQAAEALRDARYIALVTFRRDGTAAATPVWVAPLDDKLIVITQSESHKARRLRRDPRVEVRESDWRGRVREDAPAYRGTARFLEGDEASAGVRAVRAKYGIAARAWPLVGRIANRLRRRPQRPGVVIELSLTP
jgi:PPOX class probable F420-dependent enzyme